MIDNNKMVKIRWIPSHGTRMETRESMLIKQGLVNNPRVELVDSLEESDFIFLFYYIGKYREYMDNLNLVLPPKKTVVIDCHDNPHWFFSRECCAYFKRSWTEMVKKENYTTRKSCPKPSNAHPLTLAIMDEFIIDEEIERDIALSCTFRPMEHRKHLNRERVLTLLKGMTINGKTQLGSYTRGSMNRFNEPDMREYFRLLKRSRIVVTCGPGRSEGDHRTWEAFANGSLIFLDKMYFPLSHPLIDGKHCIFYEPSDAGLMELWTRILYYVENQGEAASIAKAGRKFAMKYHRASNRIDEILEVIL